MDLFVEVIGYYSNKWSKRRIILKDTDPVFQNSSAPADTLNSQLKIARRE